MLAEGIRPFIVELSSREHAQRRRVTVAASCREEAAAICEAMERGYVGYRLDERRTLRRHALTLPSDALARAEGTALYVPRDATIGGRFVRGGKAIRRPGAPVHDVGRARLALHHQEREYRIDSVGDPSILNAVTAFLYGVPWQKQIDGSSSMVYSSDTLKCSLHTVTYSANNDTDDFWNDATNEVSGTGYTTGGVTLASKASTYDTASDQIRLDAADPSWPTSTITARQAVIYKSTGTSSTSPVYANINFGADVSTTAGTFQITLDATGWAVWDVT